MFARFMEKITISVMKNRLKRLPFTLPGMAVFFVALCILVRALAARNAYEIILSLSALALWAALFLAGTWAARRAPEPDWKIPHPLTAGSAGEWRITCAGAGAFAVPKVPLFFRLHFFLKGRFFPQGALTGAAAGCSLSAEASMSRKSGAAFLNLSFPLGGFFTGETSAGLRDIFGFFSFPCGTPRERTLNIRNAPCGAKALRINTLSGAEDRRSKSSSDEERYYMREYAPGDRFRDINWKSSERIDTLITRISPDNQEKVTRVEVYFRNYGPFQAPGIADLWLLDRAKARLAWFLRKVKEEKASYVFHVRSSGGERELESDDDIDAFLEELAVLPFSPVQNEETDMSQTGGEIYVFSTACDASLPAFLLSQHSRRLSLFLTRYPPRETAERRKTESDCLNLRDFPSGGFSLPPRWLLPGRKDTMNVNSGGVMIDYAETRL